MSDVEDDICDYSTDENVAVEAEPLTCDRCCYKTQKKWLLDRHTANHAKDKPFRCPSCRFTDRDASVFVDHLVKHLPKTKFIQCCFCSFKAMPSMMKSHILRHGPTERLDCSECEYWTNSIKSMTDHIEAYHTKKHQCSMCSKVLSKYALMKHIKKVHRARKPQPILSADSLKKAVSSLPGLTIVPVTKRMKPPQLGKKPYKASIPLMVPVVQLERCRVPRECWKSLEASRKPLLQPSKSLQPTKPPQTSKPLQPLKLSQPSKLALETRSVIRKSLEATPSNWEPAVTNSDVDDAEDTSTDMKTFVEIPKAKPFRKPIYFPSLVAEFGDTLLTCSICDFQTRKEHLLKRHTSRHDDDLPFVCRKCDFQNISVYEFANHMIIHDGSVKDDVYSCCFCNFWTHKKHNIPIHLDRHRGATKEFDCPECKEVLTSKGGLQTHFEKLHCEVLDCQFCGKNMTKFQLNIHIKEHANEVLGLDQADPSYDQPVPLKVETPELPVKPTNPLRNTKYKPKPLSRKNLDLKLDSVETKKDSKSEGESSKSEVVPKASSSKYKPKPLSKKKLDSEPKTPSIKPASPVNGPSVAENSKTTSKYKPGPASKKIAKSDDKDKSAVKTERGAAKKRKCSPSPTKADSEPLKQDAGKDLECRYCDYKTQISSLMDRHREKHKADTPFKCTKCKYETLSSQKLSWHYLYHFPSQTEFPCPYCTFNSKNRKSLPLHIERHRSVRFFDCSKCQFSSNNAHGVRKHYERMHVDKYSCTICDKVMTKHAMMKHLKKRHPSVYNSPASSSVGVHSFVKHYTKYMKPVSVAADTAKGKRQKTSADQKDDQGATIFAANLKPGSSNEESKIKAAQQALAREIFGDVSDSDDSALKSSPSKAPSSGIAASTKHKPMVNSDDSDNSDSDSETVIPKLSCPKCEFITNQITEVKIHYREMHEIEYACKLCRPSVTSTKSELLSHVKKNHPAISPEFYSNIIECLAPEKPSEKNKPPVKMESEDSDDSDNEVPVISVPVHSAELVVSPPSDFAPVSSVEPVVPPPADSAPEKSVRSSISSLEKVNIESKVAEKSQCTLPMDVEELTAANDQPPRSPLVSDASEIASTVKSASSSETAKSTVHPDDTMELDVTAESEGAARDTSSSVHVIAPHPEDIPKSAASAVVKPIGIHQMKALETLIETRGENTEITKKRMQCKDCNFRTSRMSLFQRHNVKHKVGAPLVCPQCHFQNKSPYEFLLHWTKHFPDRIAFSCCFCAFATVSKLDLALHFCVHNNTRVFNCNECNYSTSTKSFFEGHIWSIHKKLTCQKCQESMVKTELPSHKCLTARDEDVLNFPNDAHEEATVSRPHESVPGENLPGVKTPEVRSAEKCGPSVTDDHGYVKVVDSGSAGKQIIAQESFRTSEFRKFSFLRKRDDFPSADVAIPARSPTVEKHKEAVGEEPSPAFESLSADSSFAKEESGNDGTLMTADDSSKTVKPNGTKDSVDEKVDSPVTGGSSVADADEIHELPAARIGERHFQKGLFATENSTKARDTQDSSTPEPPITAVEAKSQEQSVPAEESDSSKNTSNVGGSLPAEHDEESFVVPGSKSEVSGIAKQSLTDEDLAMEKSMISEDREYPDEIELPPGSSDQCLTQEDSFSAEGSFSGVPVIDISGKPEMTQPSPKPSVSKAPSTSWTEPIESDDEDGEDDDHNYFISPRRSKSPAAIVSSLSDLPRSSPPKSEDFPGDYVTEVVFDNGMTALVLEVSDSSEEEL